jgi:ERCC4-related helicase
MVVEAMKKNFEFGYSKVFDPIKDGSLVLDAKFRKAEAWVLNQNGRILRLLILLERFNVITAQLTKNKTYPINIFNKGKKVVIFCTHQATAKGLFFTLRKILPENQHNSIAATFLKVGNKRQKSQVSDIIRRFNRDDELKILIATDAFSESAETTFEALSVVTQKIFAKNFVWGAKK